MKDSQHQDVNISRAWSETYPHFHWKPATSWDGQTLSGYNIFCRQCGEKPVMFCSYNLYHIHPRSLNTEMVWIMKRYYLPHLRTWQHQQNELLARLE